jgi:hypothetical protein
MGGSLAGSLLRASRAAMTSVMTAAANTASTRCRFITDLLTSLFERDAISTPEIAVRGRGVAGRGLPHNQKHRPTSARRTIAPPIAAERASA